MLKGVLSPEGVALASLASNSSLSLDQAARISNAALRVLQRAVREILPTRISQRYRSRVLSYVTLRWPVPLRVLINTARFLEMGVFAPTRARGLRLVGKVG